MENPVIYGLLVLLALFSAVQAIRGKKLLISVMYLIFLSAAIALIFFLLGAKSIAVIELSVGAGLITVLMVFAISIVGEAPTEEKSLIPSALSWILLIGSLCLICIAVLPYVGTSAITTSGTFESVFWIDRSIDIFIQVLLLFAGVLAVLGILSSSSKNPEGGRE